jgi:hypothetical protein
MTFRKPEWAATCMVLSASSVVEVNIEEHYNAVDRGSPDREGI